MRPKHAFREPLHGRVQSLCNPEKYMSHASSRKFLTVLTLSAVTASGATAQLNLQGYTNGLFNGATPPNTAAAQTSTVGPLSYTNATFNVTTVDGTAAIGSVPSAAGTLGFNNLGSLSLLGGSPFDFIGNTFALRVTFTVPTSVIGNSSGTNSSVFSALLMGEVTANGADQGGALVTFTNPSQTFAFGSGDGAGTFVFSVNNTSVTQGRVVPITGQITGAQLLNGQQIPFSAVPEPSTVVLMGSGLVGLALAGLNRRKRNG